MTKTRPNSSGWRTRRTLFTVLALLALSAGGYGFFAWRNQQAAAAAKLNYTLLHPQRGTLVATVSASGSIQPHAVVNLNFSGNDVVASVLVTEGQQVRAGDALARLDDADLQLRVVQAQASLAQMQANAQKLQAGATPEELAAARAQIDQARGQLRQTSGSVTSQDVAAARSSLEQARANLQQLQAGPKSTDLQSTQAALDQANANLQAQRDSLSAAKTNAQLQINQSTASLTEAQSRYSTAKQNWEHVRDTGTDPVNPTTVDQKGKAVDNRPNDAQRQQYYDAFVQAEAAMHSAEGAVQASVVSFDNARQSEVTGIAAAEAQVRTAQASIDKLQAGADKDQLAAARAQVSQAEANLAKLGGDQRAGSLSAAQAAVSSAEANLSKLTAGPVSADLAVAQAQIDNAQAALQQAQLALERATLKAPSAGYVAQLNLKVGEQPVATQPAVVLADLSSFYVDVTVDEIDVARLKESQPVTLTLDALPNVALAGSVRRINLLSSDQSGVPAYSVRIETRAADPGVRAGMSASAEIVVDRKERALVVPRRAVRAEAGRLYVDTSKDTALCNADPATRPAAPELVALPVQTGLSNETAIAIESGSLNEGSCVYVAGIDARVDVFAGNGPPSSVRDSQK